MKIPLQVGECYLVTTFTFFYIVTSLRAVLLFFKQQLKALLSTNLKLITYLMQTVSTIKGDLKIKLLLQQFPARAVVVVANTVENKSAL